MKLTLRIKKIYFDAIKDGSKTCEFRSCTPYYENRFLKNPKFLTLHYQKAERLDCRINSIKIVPTPDHIPSNLVSTLYCYKINLTPIKFYEMSKSITPP